MPTDRDSNGSRPCHVTVRFADIVGSEIAGTNNYTNKCNYAFYTLKNTMYYVTLWRVHVTTFVKEMQQYVPFLLSA